MVLTNGCTTVNGGTVKLISTKKQWAEVEIMGNGYSSHPTNIISMYISNGSRKIELSIWLHGTAKFGVTFYKSKESLSGYKYNSYPSKTGQQLPEKYNPYANMLRYAYKEVFGLAI